MLREVGSFDFLGRIATQPDLVRRINSEPEVTIFAPTGGLNRPGDSSGDGAAGQAALALDPRDTGVAVDYGVHVVPQYLEFAELARLGEEEDVERRRLGTFSECSFLLTVDRGERNGSVVVRGPDGGGFMVAEAL